MKRILGAVQIAALGTVLSGLTWAQSEQPKTSPGAGHDIGSGAGDIGKGTAKGAGHLALGTAKGVGDLVTLHPVSAAGAVGKGAATGGKDITFGAVKGTGKMARGVGKLFKKL
jgi:hypothetical protein